jgi:cell division protein FtsA
MMKHIRQLAEFKTGLEVRLGYPNEYLANETADDLASPLYSTGIGLVIEGIAKYENDLKKGKYETGGNGPVKSGNVNDDESADEVTDEGKEKGGNTTKTRGFSFGDIITSISNIFKSENLDKDITE